MRIKIREALNVSKIDRVDRDAATIYGVKVLGLKSANGRRYSPSAVTKAAPLYEGARVFFDHPDGEDNARRFRERFGRLVNVRGCDDGGLVADLKYNPAHRDAEQFLWLAENDPAGMGLSHNAEGSGVREQNGGVLVEEITKVHSVDIVDGPATNLSLYEQTMNDDPLTDPAAPAPDAPDAGTGGTGDFDEKLADLVKDFAAHPELSKEAKLKKIKALVDLMEDDSEDDAQAEGAGEGESEGAVEPDMDDEKDEKEVMEQLGRFKSPAIRAVRKKLLRESRRKYAEKKGLAPEAITATFLEQLAEAPAAKIDTLVEDRKTLLREARAEKPRKPAAPAKPKTAAEIAAEMFG